MDSIASKINIQKLAAFVLKRCWIIILCAAMGFAGLYCYTKYYKKDTYTAYATMYVLNGNPNLVNYQYANANDLSSAVQLLDTYMVVVRSSKVMNVVAERLMKDYPGIYADYISSTLSMGSVSDTGAMRIISTTPNAQLSADICNAVADVAPAEIIRVVNAGSIEVIDYAETPEYPDNRNPKNRGMLGAIAGAAAAAALLVLVFIFASYKYFFVDGEKRADVLKNIWLFIPFGAILYRLSPQKTVLLIPLALSALIEGIQYYTGTGFCELDDVISNCFGGWVGFESAKLLGSLFFRNIHDQKKISN